jgi:hypothetical protein
VDGHHEPSVKVVGNPICRGLYPDICLGAKVVRSTGNRVVTVDPNKLTPSMLIRAGWRFEKRDPVNSSTVTGGTEGWWLTEAMKLGMSLYLVYWAADTTNSQCLDVYNNQQVELGTCGTTFWAIASRQHVGPPCSHSAPREVKEAIPLLHSPQ